ncbi:hypothetical protein A6769_07580 [Nostoc punctiforme NIES-2108]|uniref:DUF11 domain-containing protein n=1 Tax=Nostoc punctiforme NIES-2108 TaxID=1356359 RepID=A0A367RST7_NOSPU|nr:hypothetical protein A6769_07580 [Nostoc punctiforme NIES-2108]
MCLVSRPQNQKQITSSSSWWRRLTATVLLGSFLDTTISMPAIAQQTNNLVASLPLINQATYTYTDSASNYQYQGSSEQINVSPSPLLDPLGRILGCAGTILPDYTGFSVGVYEPNSSDPTGTELGSLVALTRTELPDIPNNNVPGGKSPNTENSNPYFVTNNPAGVYNFLLDPNKGQTDPGRTYIFVVNPPPNSIYKQRRVKIEILASSGTQGNGVVRYVASSLDGQPISLTGETRLEQTVVLVPNAETVGLDLLAFEFTTNLCQANQLQIIKTGDRATAEPGDTVIYRLSVKNLADAGLSNIFVTDDLPLGFQFLPKSVQGELDGQPVAIASERNGNTVTFRTDATIPTAKVLNIAYAAQLTADALRGNGRNTAIVNAQRADNRFSTKDGPATHQLKIRPGIVSDCGTIIGRVFVDKNFDGEQQRGEPGIPNAVIFLEDGNRITTDPNGLFSLANALPGYHTGVLDLSSVAGYTLAHNEKFRERNSQSRLVHLEPGGLVRMNFAVTPTFQEPVNK